jgi:serine acetyltransferase
MFQRFRKAGEQMVFLGMDLRRIVSGRRLHWLTVWMGRSFLAALSYRTSRASLLLLGPLWPLWRLLTAPLVIATRPWLGLVDIHPEAEIGPGLLILHPGLGVAISDRARIGAQLTLVGGNVIGVRFQMVGTEGEIRRTHPEGEIRLGDNATLGANAVILGPVALGDAVQIGAGAVVTHDWPDKAVLVGVPARPVAARTCIRGSEGSR